MFVEEPAAATERAAAVPLEEVEAEIRSLASRIAAGTCRYLDWQEDGSLCLKAELSAERRWAEGPQDADEGA